MDPFRITRFPRLDSTQTYARNHLEELRHGDVIVADMQTAGQGQYGRSWHSPAMGNLYFTMILEPEKTIPEIPEITQLAALAICRLLKIYTITGRVKLPNDVLVGGKKIAGMIGTFVPAAENVPAALLLGVGINVNMPQTELDTIAQPATSFSTLLGSPLIPEEILSGFLGLFQEYYLNYSKEGMAPFIALAREFGLSA